MGGRKDGTKQQAAAVAETLGEATALTLLKFHFMRPHLSLLKYRSFFFPITVGLVSTQSLWIQAGAPTFRLSLLRPRLYSWLLEAEAKRWPGGAVINRLSLSDFPA